MYNVLQKSTKERNDIFFHGDFNLNLLNYDTHSETNDFINLMMTHYLLPHILHPTRVTDHSATITDNIFTHITEFNSKSGNILCEISDHFPSLLGKVLLITNHVLLLNVTSHLSMKVNLLMIILL